MTLLADLKQPASRKVGVVDILAPLPLRQWTADGGFPDVYYADVTDVLVAGLLQDGEDQSVRASVAAVDSAGDGFFYDYANARVYIYTPYASTLVQAVAAFYIATHAKDFDSEDFARSSRLTGVPKIRLAIASSFGGTKKTGGGSIEVINNDGLFDNFPLLNFDAGTVSFYVAVDVLR